MHRLTECLIQASNNFVWVNNNKEGILYGSLCKKLVKVLIKKCHYKLFLWIFKIIYTICKT